jgi:putative nucleotidyltransferase with HDIG domain
MNLNAEPLYSTRARISTLTAISAALAIKDPYTQGHARRVAIYARRLAMRIGLNPTEVKNIRLGGLLHDIGKIGLREQVLNNTGNGLTANMLAEVRQHPQIGADILKDFNYPKAVIDFVYFHHEKMDGSGYPLGLISYQIPLGAKIIRVADCFDAITTDRPYQQRKSRIEAFAILHQISGTDLNSDLVEAFMADIKENGLAQYRERPLSLYRPVFNR